MRSKCLENVPHRLKVTSLNGCLMVIPILDEDRQNNRTLLLDGCPTNLPDGTTNCLNDFHLTATRINKGNTIK